MKIMKKYELEELVDFTAYTKKQDKSYQQKKVSLTQAISNCENWLELGIGTKALEDMHIIPGEDVLLYVNRNVKNPQIKLSQIDQTGLYDVDQISKAICNSTVQIKELTPKQLGNRAKQILQKTRVVRDVQAN